MKYISNIALALSFAALLTVTSCDKDNDASYQEKIPSGEDAALTISETELPPIGYSACIFDFYAKESWRIEGIPEWIDVTPTSGNAGKTTISIAMKTLGMEKDYSDNRRECMLVFASNSGYALKTFYVYQQRPFIHAEAVSNIVDEELVEEMTQNKLDKVFKWGEYGAASPYTIKVLSNIDWGWQIDDTDRYDVVKSEAHDVSGEHYTKEYTLTIIPKSYNVDKQAYFAKLGIKGIDNSGEEINETSVDYIHRDWSFEHKNLRFLIDDSPEDKILDMGEMTGAYIQYESYSPPIQQVRVDTEIPWSSLKYDNGAQHWLKYESNPKDSTLLFTVEHINESTTTRSDTLVISAVIDGVEVSRKIGFNQRPYTFRVDYGSTSQIRIGNNDLKNRTIRITTNGPWKLEVPSGWITSSVAYSNALLRDDANGFQYRGNATITFKALKQNLEFEDLVGQIKITTLDINNTRAVVQDKFVFDVTPSALLESMSAIGQSGRVPVDIDCSGPWEIANASNYTWINCSIEGVSNKTTGLATDKSFYVEVPEANPDFTKDRSATLTLVSLNHKDKGQNVTRTIKVNQLKYIWEVSSEGKTSDILFNPRAYDPNASYSLTIKCSGTWRIDDAPAWFSPTKTSGSYTDMGQTINFRTTNNTDAASRSATFHVTDSFNHTTRAITVSQDGFVFRVASGQPTTFSNVPVMAGRDGKTYTIAVEHTTDAPYSVSYGDSWLSTKSVAHSTSADGRTQISTITVALSNNATSNSRTQTVTLTSTLSSSRLQFSFSQLPYQFNTTSVTVPQYSEIAQNNGVSTNLSIVSSGDWTAENVPAWIILSENSGTVGKTIKINPTNNTSTTTRSATFRIRSILTNQYKNITVSQAAFKWNSTSASFSYYPTETDGRNINVLCSGQWTINNLPTWVKANVNSGNGNESGATEQISFTVDPNLTESDRSGTAQIVSVDNPDLRKSVSFSQGGFYFNFDSNSSSPASLHLGALDSGEYDYYFSHAGDDFEFQLSFPTGVDQYWISRTELEPDGWARVRVEPNYTKEQHIVIMTAMPVYKGQWLRDFAKTLTITQDAYEFDETPETLNFAATPASPLSVDIICTGAWTYYVTGGSWLGVSTSTSRGNGRMTITAESNMTGAARTAQITVTGNGTALKKIITVNQSAE